MLHRLSRVLRERPGKPRRPQPRSRLELLEERTLLAAVTVFPAHVDTFYRGPVTPGPDGNLWFPDSGGTTPMIGRITPTGVLTEFPLPAGAINPGTLTVGPDHNLWFPEGTAYGSYATPFEPGGIGRITPSGAITIFPTPSTAPPGALTVALDGNLWFPESFYGKFGRITPSGVVTEFALPPGLFTATPLTVGPDGNLWLNATSFHPTFTSGGAPNSVVRIGLTGDATPFPIPSGTGAGPLTVAPDGNLWFVDGDEVDRVTPSGVITGFPGAGGFDPLQLTVGPDGNLWTDNGPNIYRISTSGAVTTFTIKQPPPTDIFGAQTSYTTTFTRMTVGPDGNLYVSGNTVLSFHVPLAPAPLLLDPVVYRVTTSGEISKIPVLTGVMNYLAATLTVGGDGNLWFPVDTRIGRVDPRQVGFTHALTVTPKTPVATVGLTFIGALATFTDPNYVNGPADYSATVNFGNGPAVPGVVTVGPDGNLTVSAAHAFAQVGMQPFTITVSGPGVGPVMAIGQVTVNATDPIVTALPVTLSAGVPSRQTYATFPDPFSGSVPTDFHASIAFGDGQTAPGDITAGPNGAYLVSAAHTYAEPGSHPFQVTVTGPGGNPVTASSLATVIASNPVVAAASVALTAGLPSSRIYATFPAPYADAIAVDFHASIAFGDGQTAPGVITVGPHGNFIVSAIHTYRATGRYHPTITITGDLGGRGLATGLVVVVPPPSVIELQRLGEHLQTTRLVLTFNRPMDPTSAQDLGNYLLYPVGPFGLGGTRPQPIPIVSAVYDPSHQTVTLTPQTRLTLASYYVLTVNGVGSERLRDVTGVPLVGTSAGARFGSDFIAVVHGFGPWYPATSVAQVTRAKTVPGGPRHQVSAAAQP